MKIGCIILALALIQSPDAKAQPQGSTPSTTVKGTAPFFLSVKGGIHGTVQITARQVETRAIVERLKKELGVPIVASNIVAGHKVDLVLKAASVSDLLFALAPVVLADMEVGAGPDETHWKAIHLLGYNEKKPTPALKQVGFLLAAGHTDDVSVSAEDIQKAEDKAAAKGLEGDAIPEEPMLSVAVKDGLMSVRSRGQNLAVVLNEIAVRAAVPFDIRGAVDPVPIDIEIKDMPLLNLPVVFGRPHVRLVVRRDLATGVDIVQGILAGDARSPLR